MGRPSAKPDLIARPLRRRGTDRNAEAKRQAAIVEFVRWVAPEIIIFHVPNGGWRTKAEAGRLRSMGVLAGVLDLVLILPFGRSAYWETKTPTGRLSDDQKTIIRSLERLGHQWSVVLSIDDARRGLKALGVETREHPIAAQIGAGFPWRSPEAAA
jgi:hypothetical protein